MPSLTNRTRVGTGAEILPGIDGRSMAARRYREVLAQLVDDLGGDPSEAQSALARRAATLSIWCEVAEAAMANGDPLDVASYSTASNTLRRLLMCLGIERRSRDVSPVASVAGYLRSLGDETLRQPAAKRRTKAA